MSSRLQVKREGPGPHKLNVDPKVAYNSVKQWAEPAQKLVQAVAVRDKVHGRPVDDRCCLLGAVNHVRGYEEGVRGRIGYSRRCAPSLPTKTERGGQAAA